MMLGSRRTSVTGDEELVTVVGTGDKAMDKLADLLNAWIEKDKLDGDLLIGIIFMCIMQWFDDMLAPEFGRFFNRLCLEWSVPEVAELLQKLSTEIESGHSVCEVIKAVVKGWDTESLKELLHIVESEWDWDESDVAELRNSVGGAVKTNKKKKKKSAGGGGGGGKNRRKKEQQQSSARGPSVSASAGRGREGIPAGFPFAGGEGEMIEQLMNMMAASGMGDFLGDDEDDEDGYGVYMHGAEFSDDEDEVPDLEDDS